MRSESADMLSPITADTVSANIESGSTVEFTHEVLEEVRRLAVAGFTAFARGGLETGGVLYGVRDGTKLIVHSFTEFISEHARGPGFLLSEKDRQGFDRLAEAPAGLETLGWYRAHTRSGLPLDAGDRELFERFPEPATVLGLVVKPTQWGPSTAAFYIRDQSVIAPDAPREFAIQPPARPPKEKSPEVETQPAATELLSQPLAPPRPEAQPRTEPPARLKTQLVPQLFSRAEKRWAMAAVGAAVLLAAVILALLIRAHHPRELSLQAMAIAPGQLRISWNRNSQAALDGISGMIEIHDGEFDTRIPLAANQLQLNGITYAQKTEHVAINLRIDGRRSYAPPAEESIEFVGVVPAGVPAAADAPHQAIAPPVSDPSRGTALRRTPLEATAEYASKPPVTIRPFAPPAPHKNAAAPSVSLLPAAPPPVPVTTTPQAALPDLLSKAPILARPPVSQPVTAPRTGRLIWTGKLRRHEIVEIAGGTASVGSLSGSLNGTPAEFRILPGEFTRDGLSIYSPDGTAHGRTEAPSVWNGWNPVTFEFDPVRVKELVVLEAPSRLNGYKRLTLRCDSRTCPVVVVDWTAR